jgi:sulfide:quinone oxidoreductase
MIRAGVSEETSSERTRVVIVGGGVTGLETLLGLSQLAGDLVEITLVAPEPDFLYKPLLVEEPFGVGPAERHEVGPIAKERGASFVQKALSAVRPDDHVVELDDGAELEYDALVVCVGGRLRPALGGAITFPGPEPLRIQELLDRAAEDEAKRIAFVVPSGATWALPMYELALMTERWSREKEHGEVGVVVVTPEASPLIMFGRVASGQLAALLEARGISVETGAHARERNGGLILTPGDRPLEAGVVVALPVIEGPSIAGLPANDHGFIPIDEHARVLGAADVYAAGDGTTFPIKQGGLGTQQADAAVEHIASAAGAELDPKPFHPVLRGKLLTGDESLHMRHDVTGGAGEGTAAADYLWWPPQKIGGRFLAPFLGHEEPSGGLEPPRHPLDVEVSMPVEWHEEPMALDPYGPLDVD